MDDAAKQPDCQSTPELLGEEGVRKALVGLEDAVARAWPVICDGRPEEVAPIRAALRNARAALKAPASSMSNLTPEEARELYSIWLCSEIKDEVDQDHPVYTAGVKLGEMQPHPEDEAASTQPESPGNSGEWQEQFLALKDRLFSEETRKAALAAGIEVRDAHARDRLSDRPTGKPDHEDIVFAVLRAAWNHATGHEFSVNLTQPIPGNSGGVEGR